MIPSLHIYSLYLYIHFHFFSLSNNENDLSLLKISNNWGCNNFIHTKLDGGCSLKKTLIKGQCSNCQAVWTWVMIHNSCLFLSQTKNHLFIFLPPSWSPISSLPLCFVISFIPFEIPLSLFSFYQKNTECNVLSETCTRGSKTSGSFPNCRLPTASRRTQSRLLREKQHQRQTSPETTCKTCLGAPCPLG